MPQRSHLWEHFQVFEFSEKIESHHPARSALRAPKPQQLTSANSRTRLWKVCKTSPDFELLEVTTASKMIDYSSATIPCDPLTTCNSHMQPCPFIVSDTSTRTASLLVGRLKRLKLADTKYQTSQGASQCCCPQRTEHAVSSNTRTEPKTSEQEDARLCVEKNLRLNKTNTLAPGTPATSLIVQRAHVQFKAGATANANQLHGFSWTGVTHPRSFATAWPPAVIHSTLTRQPHLQPFRPCMSQRCGSMCITMPLSGAIYEQSPGGSPSWFWHYINLSAQFWIIVSLSTCETVRFHFLPQSRRVGRGLDRACVAQWGTRKRREGRGEGTGGCCIRAP